MTRTPAGYADIEGDLLGALGEAVIATDLNGSIIFWNRAAETLYGWASEDVLGRGILDVTPTPLSRDEAAAIFADLLQGKTWSGEFDTRHKTGREMRVAVTDFPVRDKTGELAAIVGISRPAKAGSQQPAAATPAPVASVLERAVARRDPRREWLVFGGLFVAAVCLRLLCDLFLADRLPFITFLPAAAFGAILLSPGRSAALLLLCAAAGLVWIRYRGIDDPWVAVSAPLLFLVFGGMLVAVLSYGAALHRKLTEREERLALLNGELTHRIKNLFALATSVSLQTIRASASLPDAANAIVGRLQAIAAAQELSTASTDGIAVRTLIERIVHPISPGPKRLIIAGPQTVLSETDATSFSLLLHELATNAIKYGAWSNDDGVVSVSWTTTANALDFLWEERGAATETKTAMRAGFGTMLIRRAFPRAHIHHEVAAGGARCRVTLPL